MCCIVRAVARWLVIISKGKPKELGGKHASLTLRSPCSYQVKYKSKGLRNATFLSLFRLRRYSLLLYRWEILLTDAVVLHMELRKIVVWSGGVWPEKLKHEHVLWAAQSILLSAAHRPNRGGFVTTVRANETCNRKEEVRSLPACLEGRRRLRLQMTQRHARRLLG
jgi:hypothetical protein